MKLILTLFTCLFLSFSVFGNELVVLSKTNFIVMNSEFNKSSTATVMSKVLNLPEGVIVGTRIPFVTKKTTVYLIMDSPGGSVFDGLTMIDFLLAQPYEFKTITLFAASMGFITVQFLGERLITPSGYLMSHRAAGGMQGELGYDGKSQFDSRYNFIKRRLSRIDKTIVERTNGKQTLKSYQKLYENEYYCEGLDCVKDGFADTVIDLTCDSDLSKQTEERKSVQFMGMSIPVLITKSECPLIGILNVELDRKSDGNFVSIYDKNVDKDLRNKIKLNLNIK